MTVLTLATVALAGVIYIALRLARPHGIAVSPWPYILSAHPTDRFIRNWPEPGAAICDAEPTREAWEQLREHHPRMVAMTRCYLPPDVTAVHHGLLIERGLTRAESRFPHTDPFVWQSWQWLGTPERRTSPYRRRPAWWRRALIRLASA